MAPTHRRLAAIMFTDMVGYSAQVQRDERAALEDLSLHNALLRPVFRDHHGREVKTVGDAFLVEFESALDAARCAVEVQRVLRDRNAARPPAREIAVRIGIHVGDVEESDGDVLGDAVNIASRIEPLAEPGGICLTQQAFDQIQGKIDLPVVRLAPTTLKNIRSPVAVYRAILPWQPGAPALDLGVASDAQSLAVLPLANISPDANDAYFADGLTDELISALSQGPDLRVIARTSVVPYKSTAKPLSQVGAELGVSSILEGSVRKAGNRLRIALQLVDVATQHPVWASTYNRDIDDIFAVQTDVAERTAEALRVRLAKPVAEGVARRPTADPRAYDLYLRGLVASGEMEETSYATAAKCFEEATRLDPSFAEAFGQWANLYVVRAGDFVAFRDVMPKARELARRALELDPRSSDAHAALANIALQYEHDWTKAEAEFRKALEYNPSNVTAMRYYGTLLRTLGRFSESQEILRRAIRLDPASDIEGVLAFLQQDRGDFSAAIAFGERHRDKDPEDVAGHVYLGFTYLAAGRQQDALREASAPLGDADDTVRFDHALLNALVGRPELAREVVAAAERGEAKSYTSDCHLAMMYSAFGETDRAVELLEKDYRDGDRVLWLFYRGVFFDPIRNDPRFRAIVARFGLPDIPLPRGRDAERSD